MGEPEGDGRVIFFLEERGIEPVAVEILDVDQFNV